MLVSISAKAKPRDENNRTLNSLTAVQLPSDVYEKYVATFFPKKRVRTGLSANHFGPLAQYLAEVTAYIQVTMSNLRAIHNYSTVLDLNDHDQNSGRRNIAMFVRDREQDRALSSADRLVADDVIKSADLDSASLHKALAADAAQKFLMSMSRGNNAVIREGRGEKEPCVYFDLLGSRLGNTSPTLNEVYTESNFIPALASEHVLLEETELGKHVLAAGREIISGLTGAGADNAVREYMRFALDFDVAEFVEGVLAKHRLSEAACRFRPSAPRELKFFSEGYRLVIVKEPEIEAVNAKRSESRVKFNEAATVLSQHIHVSLSLRVPMEMARYAAQAVGNEKLSLQSLNSWINLWCFGFMRSKGSKVAIRPADIPRYVMPPSTAFALAERRRQLGLYVEPGRTNADRLTVSAKGGLQYMPNNGEVDQNLSKQYEADQEKILAECFRLGIPLTTESENEFARVDPQVDEKLKLLAENLKQYSGALLSNSWDYNCAMVVNINEPERNHAIRLAGSTIPDELVLSKFLSEPTGTALRHMFTEARMYDAEDEKVIPYDETKLSNSSVVNVTTFTHLIRSYLYLREINAAQPLEKLISMAAAELKLDRLEDSPYEKGLYQPYLDNTMRLTEAALQKLPQALSSIIGDAFTDASGEPGSNVLRVTAKEDRELEEDDHYFNVKFHKFDEIGRVYNYLGGRVLYHIARAVLEAPREALLSPTKGTDIQRPAFQHVSDLVLPFATALVRYVPDAKRIHEVAEKLQETLIPDDNFEASQLKIPGLKDDFRLFPHQADAFKTLSRFPRYALLDVAPGGGKTTLLLVDIANMIAHGKIKRPLVICPSNLAKDWCAEMHRHTEGKWNMIPINGTAWSSSWGDATLTDMIKNAPPNTIVVVGYDFLSAMHTYKYPVVIGTHVEMVSEPLEFLKKFGFDYIGIDESHRTKRFGKNGARPSVRHSSAKAITTMSCVKYIRLGTGSFVYNDMSDPVGQAALFGAHIYRTLDEYEEENKTTIEVDGRRVTVWREDTPYKARKRLGEYAAVVSARRRDWAFMLPIPIETFIPVNLEKRPEDDGYELLKDIPDAHLLCYNTVLNTTLEEIRQNPRIMALLNGAGSEDDDDGSDSEGASKRLVGNATIDVQQSDDDESVVDKLESALAPYLQRLDRLLTDPLGDTDAAGNPFGELFFRGIQAKDFVSNVVLAVIKRLRIHFTPNPWRKGESYTPQTVVDFGNRTFIARPDQSVHADAFTSVQAPDIDTKNWSEQARGKVIIFCRYKRTVDAIMRALPEDFARTAVGFHGGIKNRADNLDRFKKDDRVQIIVAQESAISEGHNMQMASRIIRVETPWAPGELDQAISRIFRPDPRSKFKRETIFLDWVLVNNTLSVAKLGRIISKIVHKAKFDEATNPLYDDLNSGDLPVISMSIDNLRDLRNLSDILDYMHEYQKLARITAKEFIDMRKTRRMEMIDVPPSPMMPGASVIPFTPLVLGQEIPDRDNVGVIRYADYMQRVDDPDVQAITADPRILVGRYARTEFGYGVIESVTRRSAAADGEEEDSGIRGWRLSMATIRYANGSTGDVPASMLYLTPDMDEKIYAKYGGSIKKPTERDRREAAKIKNVVPQRERDGQDRMRHETTSFVEEATRRSVISGTLAQRLDALFDQGRKDIVPVPPKKVKEVLPANTDLSTFDPRDDIAEVQREGQLFVTLYNGFWCVEVDAIESTDRWLKKQFGFETGVSYAYFKVANRNNYRAALDWLDRNFTIPATSRKRLDAFEGAFSGSGRNPGFRAELSPVGEMQAFLTERHRMTRQAGTKPTINVYPLLLNDNLLFVVDLGTNPGIVKHIGKAIPKTSPVAKVGQVDSISMKFFRQRSDVVQFINELRKKMKVLNYADVKEDFNNLKTIAAKLK